MREADNLDRAADLTEELAQAAVADVRRRALPEQSRNADGSWPVTDCDDCGNEIPKRRLALGKIRCIYCQSARERSPR